MPASHEYQGDQRGGEEHHTTTGKRRNGPTRIEKHTTQSGPAGNRQLDNGNLKPAAAFHFIRDRAGQPCTPGYGHCSEHESSCDDERTGDYRHPAGDNTAEGNHPACQRGKALYQAQVSCNDKSLTEMFRAHWQYQTPEARL
jgi:hypothetical protein